MLPAAKTKECYGITSVSVSLTSFLIFSESSRLFNQHRLAVDGQFTLLQGGNDLLHGRFLVVEGDVDHVFLRHFMFDDPVRCREDRTYPLA